MTRCACRRVCEEAVYAAGTGVRCRGGPRHVRLPLVLLRGHAARVRRRRHPASVHAQLLPPQGGGVSGQHDLLGAASGRLFRSVSVNAVVNLSPTAIFLPIRLYHPLEAHGRLLPLRGISGSIVFRAGGSDNMLLFL